MLSGGWGVDMLRRGNFSHTQGFNNSLRWQITERSQSPHLKWGETVLLKVTIN